MCNFQMIGKTKHYAKNHCAFYLSYTYVVSTGENFVYHLFWKNFTFGQVKGYKINHERWLTNLLMSHIVRLILLVVYNRYYLSVIILKMIYQLGRNRHFRFITTIRSHRMVTLNCCNCNSSDLFTLWQSLYYLEWANTQNVHDNESM